MRDVYGAVGTFYGPVTIGGRPPVVWPHRVGVVPPVAVGRLERPVDVALREATATENDAAVVCQVLVGLGGVGKTQLAASLAHRWWQDRRVELLIWVTATSRIAVLTRYALAAADVTGVEDPDPSQGAERLLAWLASTGRQWLIVLDDLTDPTDLTGLWPPATSNGRTVITTRRRDAALLDGRTLIDVNPFTVEEAVGYLQGKLRDRPDRLDEASELAEDVGRLPLALAQVAAYIVDQDLTCADYRRRLARRRLNALRPRMLPDDQQAAIADTWSLSIDLANASTNGTASVLLQLAALLDSNGIPPQLFTTSAVVEYCTTRIGQLVDDDDSHDALRALHRLSLITAPPASTPAPRSSRGGSGTAIVRVHALLQRVVRECTPVEHQHDLAVVAANALQLLWPDREPDAATAQPLRSNTTMLHQHTGDHLWTIDGAAHPVLFQTGRSLGLTGLVAAARDYFEQLRHTATRYLGSNHVDTLRARSNHAWWQGMSGEVARAITALDQLLLDRLSVLGPGHPGTLSTRNDLYAWRAQTEDPARAVTAFKELVGDYVLHLGPDHSGTLTARNNLARWMGRSGNAEGAATAFQDLTRDCLRVLGPDHPDTLRARSNLAWWRGDAGDSAGAIETFHEVLADRLRVLGPDHPDTLRTRSNIASWRGHAGDPASAVAILRQVLNDRLRVLGTEHPDTLRTQSKVARWQGIAGDPVGAAAAFQQVLIDRLRVLGPDHPDVLDTRKEIVYWRQQSTPATNEPTGAGIEDD